MIKSLTVTLGCLPMLSAAAWAGPGLDQQENPRRDAGDAGVGTGIARQDAQETPHAAEAAAHERDKSLMFQIREVGPLTAVFTEYEGPYWGVGPVLDRVRADMLRAGHKGATFVRYERDPRGRSIVPGLTKVGYLAEPGIKPDGVYAVEHWPREEVVTLTVLGPNTGTMSLYPEMRGWAESRGCEVLGPIVEVYYPLAVGASVENQQTEIRMPVRWVDADHAEKVDVRSQQGAEVGRDGESAEVNQGLTRISKVEPFTPETESLGPAAAKDFRATDQERDPDGSGGSESADAEPYEPPRRVAELLTDGRYEEALRVLFASAREQKTGRASLELIGDRLEAIADGLEAMGQESDEVTRLSQVYRKGLDLLRTEETGRRTVNTSPRDRIARDIETSLTEAVRRLDRLMGRIAMRDADQRACLSEIHEVLGRIASVYGK